LFSYEHDDIKEFILKLLNYCGVIVRSEVRVGDRVFDVLACYEGRVSCVEVSKSSDLAKDLDSLRRASCDSKFIVWLKPYEPPEHIDDVRIITRGV